ncbi:head-tail connector protein [Alkaliphilus transvaalensis]|uniref:head-tail connector protein n=1 Tax=Alkaliphilus transvaalensis TaxID=114628 RepID=UPI00047DAE31|nr:head-tail connector protein [Alkaliphilus transvaalensis]
MIPLEEVKLYLRVEGDEENALISSFIEIARNICEDILRYPLSELEEVPVLVKQAMLYCIANMYEKREGTHHYMKNESGGILETINMMKLMLNSLRKESW